MRQFLSGRRTSKSAAVGLVAAGVGALVLTAGLAFAASPPSHATVPGFHFQTNDFKIDSKGSTEVVMPTFTINPGLSNGWHTHPGPGFIIVTSGTLTLYRALDDGTCDRSVFGPGEGFVEAPGQVHIARNEGTVPLTGVATFLDVPAGTTAFRTSVAAPAACPGIN